MRKEVRVLDDVVTLFEDFEGPCGMVSVCGGPALRIEVRSRRFHLLFLRSCSVARLNSSSQRGLPNLCGVSSVVQFPDEEESRYSLEATCPRCHVTLLFPSPPLLKKASRRYRFDRSRFDDCLHSAGEIPRKTWLDECLYRYVFERVEARAVRNDCTRFLEVEIVKELFCTWLEERERALKFRFAFDRRSVRLKHPVLQKALELLGPRVLAPLSTTGLAEACHTSPSTLKRIFLKEFGKSPMEYVWEQRLLAARDLLERSDHPVGTIADMVGFGNASAFSAAYRRRFGESPSRTRGRDGRNDLSSQPSGGRIEESGKD